MVSVSFTGSRKGMTEEQKVKVREILLENYHLIEEVRHGDCVGADTDFHKIADSLDLYCVIHPPLATTYRAYNKGDYTAPPKPYLQRNKDIVLASKGLIATPNSNKEEIRSGTWSTIRYAQKLGRRVFVIYPCGRIENFYPLT